MNARKLFDLLSQVVHDLEIMQQKSDVPLSDMSSLEKYSMQMQMCDMMTLCDVKKSWTTDEAFQEQCFL